MTFPLTITEQEEQWLDLCYHIDEYYYSECYNWETDIRYVEWLNQRLMEEGLQITVDAHPRTRYNLSSMTFHTEEVYMLMMMKYG